MNDQAAPSAPAAIKAVLLTNMLAPYRVSFYRALARRVALTVVVDELAEANREWSVATDALGFPLLDQRNRAIRRSYRRADMGFTEGKPLHLSLRTPFTLRALRPDVVISLELGLRSFWAVLHGALHGVPVILMHEGTPHTQGSVSAAQRAWRRALIRRGARYWSNGRESTALLAAYGADRDAIDAGMTGIDTAELRRRVAELWPSRERLRGEMGLRGPTFLYTASLSGRKGLQPYLRALGRLAERFGSGSFSALIVGSGEQAAELASWRQAHPDVRCVAPGFVQPADLVPFYVAADWGVLPTLEDNWPLATLEMLVAGLPQLFSRYNGAAAELCDEGHTGLLFDPLSERDFDRALQTALEAARRRLDPGLIDRFAGYYGPEAQADRALASVEAAVGRQRRSD